MSKIILLFLCFTIFVYISDHPTIASKLRTVYQRITHEDQFFEFNQLIRGEKNVITDLQYSSLTVFVPSNNAIQRYRGYFRIQYHMSYDFLDLNRLTSMVNFNSCIYTNAPPIWVTKRGDDLFLNNAKLLVESSNYISKTFNGEFGKSQALHMVDEVLDPLLEETPLSYPPNAYDLLTNFKTYDFEKKARVTNFFHKIHENKLQHIFKQNGTNTYFIPVDFGIDNYKYSMIDKYIIYGHVIQNVVLFTRPTEKNFPFESMANGDYIYIVLYFFEVNDKIFIKSNTVLGDSTHQKGEIIAEVVKANIPVQNGVVHLISRPLAIFDRKLKPFPYLPIIEKISTDPELDHVYTIGRRSHFNDILKNESLSMTYFVARDTAWKKMEENNLKLKLGEVDVLKKHLVISDTTFSMAKLLSLSIANNYTDISLETMGGPVYITVLQMDGIFFVKFQNKYIKVHRPDYECSNGIIHILDAPIAALRTIGEENEETDGSGFWRTLKNLFT